MTTQKNKLLLGAHMSIAGGLEKAIIRGESIRCSTIQIFTKSNRQWQAKPLTEEQIILFKETVNNSTIHPIVTHACYLINIAAQDSQLYEKSVNALIEELERCEQLGIPYLVLHPGSSTGHSEREALQKLINGINTALEKAKSSTMLLLETMAGQGSILCATLEQLAFTLNGIKKVSQVGICIDTCHMFAAGYDFTTPEKYYALWREFDQIIGIEKIKVIHLNDSQKKCGSRVDRHANIAQGEIGEKAFSLLMNDPRFFNIPKILETPQTSEYAEADYRKNMDTLEKLLIRETR